MNQSSAEISEKRKSKYRDLLDEIEEIQENEDNKSENLEMIDNTLNVVDKLLYDEKTLEKLSHTDEFVLDATLIAKANNVLNKYTNTIVPVLDTYNPTEFGAKLRQKLLQIDENADGNEEQIIDFSKLYKISQKTLRMPPEFNYMCGFEETVVERTQKARKVRQKVVKIPEAARKQPEKIVNVNKEEEDSVDNTVKFLHWALNKEYKNNNHEPVNYFMFTFDPESFRQTVENCFHLAFLVRDARASISQDENGIYVLTPVSSKELKNTQGDTNFLQHITSLDTDVWKKAIKVFNIRRSVLQRWKIEWDEKNKDK